MNRLLLLLPLAAFATGCYSAPPCDPVANVYWGFTVPGLTPPALTCSEAGVDTVRIFVDGSFLEDVACSTQGVDGIQLVGYGHGTHRLQLEAYTGGTTGTLRYSSDGSLAMNSCTTNFDVVPTGLDGRLSFQYSFTDGQNLCAGTSYLWFRVTSGGAVYDSVDDTSTDPLALPCSNTTSNRFVDVINPSQTAPNLRPIIPAGVYTRTRFEEVSPQGGTFVPQRANCASEVFVHAGDDVRPVTLSASSSLCP